jgi:hypothetical protein
VDATPDATEHRRRDGSVVWVSTGRRAAAARVGRRWRDVRGPLLASGALALIQAGLVYLVLQAIDELGLSPVLLVPVVACSTLALVAWMGLVRHAFGAVVPMGQAPAVRLLEVLGRTRTSLREGFTPTTARLVALSAHAELGYGAVAVTDRRRVLAHVGLGGDHHGPGHGRPAGRRRRHGRAAGRAPADRVAARLRRPRLSAEVGGRSPRSRRAQA